MIKSRVQPIILVLLSSLALLLVAPSHLTLFTWDGQGLAQVSAYPTGLTIPTDMPMDLDNDGHPEILTLNEGQVEIWRDSLIVWSSPSNWDVVQTKITDLNNDGNFEIALLLWRPFSPWPIDAYIPHPGRIQDFHDSDHRSCHLILVGWSRGAYRELWAGSALADPLLAFTAIDINRDGQQELVATESRYDARLLETSWITVWEWNGFGFTLLSRGPKGYFHSLTTVKTSIGQELLLTQGILRR